MSVEFLVSLSEPDASMGDGWIKSNEYFERFALEDGSHYDVLHFGEWKCGRARLVNVSSPWWVKAVETDKAVEE